MLIQSNHNPLPFLKLISHDLRWQIVQTLAMTDLRVGEIVDRIGQPTNLVSYHLRQLREGNIVSARRSTVDKRDVYYSLNFHNFDWQWGNVREVIAPPPPPQEHMNHTHLPDRAVRVLFVCANNSARSQMAEALLNNRADRRHVVAYSAGIDPTRVKPEAIYAMQQLGLDISQSTAKSVDEFVNTTIDYVITICDEAREYLSGFNKQTCLLHWGQASPSNITNPEARRYGYVQAALALQDRINYFLSSV